VLIVEKRQTVTGETGNEAPLTLASLQPGLQVQGKVTKILLGGALVDIGAEVEAQIHISDLGQERVFRVADVLSEGEQITAWVKKVDPVARRIALTLVPPPKYRFEDLVPGQRLEGKVVRLTDFGAFVDIGAPTDGLVHLSEMRKKGRVSKPSEVVKEGEEVVVWVKDVDARRNRISLTMIEPPRIDIHQLEPGMIVEGTVVRLERFGAFVDIGAAYDGMIHVTELSDGYVAKPSDVVSVGQRVQARVLSVEPEQGRIALSLKEPEENKPAKEVVIEEELISPIELAFQRATKREAKTEARRRKKERVSPQQAQLDEIISRTLQDHRPKG